MAKSKVCSRQGRRIVAQELYRHTKQGENNRTLKRTRNESHNDPNRAEKLQQLLKLTIVAVDVVLLRMRFWIKFWTTLPTIA